MTENRQVLRIDDTEYLDVAWCPKFVYLACIRRQGRNAARHAVLFLMEPREPVEDYDNFDWQLPLETIPLQSSQGANLLSFSPAGNWLIVGRSIEVEGRAVFNLYNLN